MQSGGESIGLTVPGWSVGADGGVLYLVHLEKNGVEWNVRRRFQEFVALHAEVRRHIAPDALPDLPPKQLRLGLGSAIEPDFVGRGAASSRRTCSISSDSSSRSASSSSTTFSSTPSTASTAPSGGCLRSTSSRASCAC